MILNILICNDGRIKFKFMIFYHTDQIQIQIHDFAPYPPQLKRIYWYEFDV